MKAARTSQRPVSRRRGTCYAGRAFTLIELMVVVGIIGLVMAMGVPTLYKLFHRDGFRKAVNDVMEVCDSARARAILQQTTAEIIFYPAERRCEVAGGVSARFPDDTMIEMLDVNLWEYKDAEEARVHFYPNGTSDEMTLILRSGENEWRKISLDVTTGLVLPVETDPNTWR
jgi:prepilin-type N-terminal cleavage/methylation domain-containing protein